MTRKLSYCLYGVDPTKPLPDPAAVDRPRSFGIGGLFQWAEAVNQAGGHGIIFPHMSRDALEQFDIVHVNYTPRNSNYVLALRDVLGEHSDTKIVANVDFAVTLWNNIDPMILKSVLDKCDMVFHVEPIGAGILSEYLGRKVYTLPHPVDVDGIREHVAIRPTEEPVTISCQYHRYNDNWYPYFYALNALRSQYGIRTSLVNVSERSPAAPSIESLFDHIHHRYDYEVYLDLLSRMFINVDVTQDVVYGRGVVDAAALGIPTVGCANTYSMNILFPELIVERSFDCSCIRDRVERLLTMPDLASDMSKLGVARCSYFSLGRSYNRLVLALERAELI